MTTETVEFKAELKQLMDIIVHSLYSHREIFLRELISNACDAIDKLRFEALTDTALTDGDEAWAIDVEPDAEACTLTIRDNGIGMSRATIADELGTIARSGTKAFLEQIKSQEGATHPELIGQFGVGFYAAFMVADRIVVTTSAAGGSEAVRWTSEGQGTYTIEDAEKEGRGTEIVLHLKEDAKEFSERSRITALIKKYSDFIEHPVRMEVPRPAEGDAEPEIVTEAINSGKAIWRRRPAEVEEEEHASFFRQVSRGFGEPAKVIHYRAEGTIEFDALLYVPAQKPFDLFMGEAQAGLHLYVQRVMIMDDCEELLPPYLRFLKGVVESSDLPLNVSREMIQQDRVLTKIRSNLVNKVLKVLAEMKTTAYDEYVALYQNFGELLKEGLASDWENKDALSELLLFGSMNTEAGSYTSLAGYVTAMGADQDAIYYINGEDRAALEHSPYLELFRDRGQDVLFFTDPIDEWIPQSLTEYEGKPLKAVDRGEIESAQPVDADEYAAMLGCINDRIEEVKSVRLSTRLRESAACLVADEGDMGAHMQRLMARMGRDEDVPEFKRILELNSGHPAVKRLREIHAEDADDPRVEDYGRLLYDQAVVAEGSKIADPAAFARRVNALIVGEDAEDTGEATESDSDPDPGSAA